MKTITMDYDEYQKELSAEYFKGAVWMLPKILKLIKAIQAKNEKDILDALYCITEDDNAFLEAATKLLNIEIK